MARKSKVGPEAMLELARLYNAEGLKSVKKKLEADFGIKQPYAYIRRMKEDAALNYDPVSNRFVLDSKPEQEPQDASAEAEEAACAAESGTDGAAVNENADEDVQTADDAPEQQKPAEGDADQPAAEAAPESEPEPEPETASALESESGKASASEAEKDVAAQHEAPVQADNADVLVGASSKDAAIDKLMRDLVTEKLLELDRYIKIDALSKTIVIDENRLVDDGYTVVYQ